MFVQLDPFSIFILKELKEFRQNIDEYLLSLIFLFIQ